MCICEIDRAGFPLVARSAERVYYHFFPLTRIQFEIAVASGWLADDPRLAKKPEAVTAVLDRGEVIYPKVRELQENTPEHNQPIEMILFPGGYKRINQLARRGLSEIDDASIYSFYLTNLKLAEYASLIAWLGGDRYSCGIPTHQGYAQVHLKFMHIHIRDMIAKLLDLEDLNPRARHILELFKKYKGVINGLPRDIFEMTGNYVDGASEKIMEYRHGNPLPGVGPDGYPLYYPVIAGETKLWPYIPVQGKVRHLKVEYHPLVGARGVFKRKKS